MLPTLRDIAEATQTSISTVSRALAGGAKAGGLASVTRERIEAAAHRLGYQPNLAAQALRLRRSNTVALLCRISSPFFSRLAHLIDLRLHARGYWLMYCNSDEDLQRQAEFLRHFPQRGIDGVIVVPTTDDAAQIKNNVAADFPLVVLQRPVEGLGPIVAPDREQAVNVLCQMLQRAGVRRIALISGPLSAYGQNIEAQTVARGMTVVQRFEGPMEHKTGRHAYHLLHGQPQLRFDAIVCTGPMLAYGVLESMSNLESLSPMPIVAAMDSLPFMALLPFPIVCAVDDITALAEGSVNTLLSLLENKDARKAKVPVPPMTLFPCDIEYNKAFAARLKGGPG